jgi:hypothetical protein
MADNLLTELLIINQTHYKGDGYTFEVDLKRNIDFTKKGCSVALLSMAVYNSTYNIFDRYNNNQISITFLGTTRTYTIPNGYYSFDDISSFIQYNLLQNGWYWLDGATIIYPITLSENAARYACQLNVIAVPNSTTATQKKYTIPSGAGWAFPSVASTPQISFNQAFSRLIGFYNNTYTFPPTPLSSDYSFVSNFTPTISPVYCYVVTCSLLNNQLNPSINNVLGQIPLNASFGGLVQSPPVVPQMLSVSPKHTNKITIQLLDQNLDPIYLVDPEITCILILKY